MSIPTGTPTRPDAAVELPRPRVVRERSIRRGRLGAAIALMAVFALGAAALYAYVSQSQPYLAVARDVPMGAQLSAADLVTVHINPDPALAVIPAGRSAEVIGRYAAVPLMPGMLLAEEALTDQQIPAPGEQVVGVALQPGQMPSTPLHPGDRVLLVTTGEEQADDGTPVPAPTVAATVVHVAAGGRNGSLTVSVAVPEQDGPLVARLSGEGRLVVVLTAGSP
jgi:hypothetical protein